MKILTKKNYYKTKTLEHWIRNKIHEAVNASRKSCKRELQKGM